MTDEPTPSHQAQRRRDSAQSDLNGQQSNQSEMTETTESDGEQASNEQDANLLPENVPKKVTVAGVPIRFENFTTAEEDPTIGPVSFLSYPGEWHAAGVGYIVTVVATLSLALGMTPGAVVSVAAGSGVVLRGAFQTFRQSAHVKDALKEPAYAAFGSILGLLPIIGFLVNGKIQAFGGIS